MQHQHGLEEVPLGASGPDLLAHHPRLRWALVGGEPVEPLGEADVGLAGRKQRTPAASPRHRVAFGGLHAEQRARKPVPLADTQLGLREVAHPLDPLRSVQRLEESLGLVCTHVPGQDAQVGQLQQHRPGPRRPRRLAPIFGGRDFQRVEPWRWDAVGRPACGGDLGHRPGLVVDQHEAQHLGDLAGVPLGPEGVGYREKSGHAVEQRAHVLEMAGGIEPRHGAKEQRRVDVHRGIVGTRGQLGGKALVDRQEVGGLRGEERA